MVWPYGKETWCNLEGRYLHLVGDFSATFEENTASSPGTLVSMCQLGVFGTKYVRTEEEPLEQLVVVQGQSETLQIQNISSAYEIGNQLAIKLRQKSTLTFVTPSETITRDGYTDLIIDASRVKPGVYNLVIESYDAASSVQSTLRTDTIEVTIKVNIPRFVSDPQSVTLTPGQDMTWALPQIADTGSDIDEIIIDMDSALKPYIFFKKTTKEFIFADKAKNSTSKNLIGKFLQIHLKLVNKLGQESQIYSIIVNFMKNEQILQTQDQEERSENETQKEVQQDQRKNENQKKEENVKKKKQNDAPENKKNINKVAQFNDKVFEYVPLGERLDMSGSMDDLDSFYASILKQREIQNQAVAKFNDNENDIRPPEMRIKAISQDGIVQIEFTNAMKFPSMTDFIQLNAEQELLVVQMISRSEDDPNETNLVSWQITTVTPTLVSIQLEFKRPLKVSQDDQPDQLAIQAQLSQYPDENRQTLPISIVRVKDIPQQFASASEANISQNTALTATYATVATGTLQVVMLFALQASLSQLWSMLNSQQISCSMPLYEKLKFPASAMTITKELIKIATFDLLPTDWISEILWDYFPEDDPFSLNFETVGIDSKLFLENSGITFYIVSLNVIFGLLHFILLPLRHSCGCMKKLTDRMENYLYFNGTIRLYTEIFFDICLQASLNLYTIEWVTLFYSINISNHLAIVFIGLICIFPICGVLYSCFRPKQWTNQKFQNRCGSTILEGTSLYKQIKQQRALLFLPIMFFMRRAIFITMVLLFRKDLWLQLSVQNFISLTMIIYLQWYRPYEGNSRNRSETFNEAIIIILTYFLFCFSDFVPEAETRNDLGKYYSGVILVYIALHIFAMIYSNYRSVRLCCLKRSHAKAMAKMKANQQQKAATSQTVTSQVAEKQTEVTASQLSRLINAKPKPHHSSNMVNSISTTSKIMLKQAPLTWKFNRFAPIPEESEEQAVNNADLTADITADITVNQADRPRDQHSMMNQDIKSLEEEHRKLRQTMKDKSLKQANNLDLQQIVDDLDQIIAPNEHGGSDQQQTKNLQQ